MPFPIGGRGTIEIDEGPFAGVSCDVDSIDSYPVQALVLARVDAFMQASGDAELIALGDLYESFASLGRPTWNLCNAKGPVPPTRAGLLGVPVPLMLQLVELWTQTYQAEIQSTEPNVEPDPSARPTRTRRRSAPTP